MTKATKEALKADARVAALQDRIVKGVKMSASESKKLAEGLINKYGDKAEELAVNCLMRPYEIQKVIGKGEKCTSRSMLEYFNDEKRSAEIVNASLDKSGKIKVKTPTTEKRVEIKASMKQDATTAKKKAEAQKRASDNKKAEEERKQAAAQKAKAARKDDEKKAIAVKKAEEDERKATKAAAKKAEEERRQAVAKKAEEERRQAAAKKAEEERKKAAAKKAEEERKQVAAKKAEEAKKAMAAKTQEQKEAAQRLQEWQNNVVKNGKGMLENMQKNVEEFNASIRESALPFVVRNSKPKTLTTDEKLLKAKGEKDYITFNDLHKAGIDVTKEDIQAVINKQKTLDDKAKVITSITPGKKSQFVANWMTRNISGAPGRDCLKGPQKAMAALYGDENSPIYALSEEWDKYKYKGKDGNSACDAHNLLDKSGDWITIDIKNSAYHDPSKNGEMQAFNSKLRPGTIASTDNRAVEGRKGMFEDKGSSAQHGHIWVRNNKKSNSCNWVQQDSSITFSNYGKNMHVTLSTDSQIPDDLAKQFIEEAENRKKQNEMVQEKAYAMSR